MYRDAAIWGLVAALAGAGCSSGNPEATRRSVLAYSTTIGAGQVRPGAEATPKQGPPRLVRKTPDDGPAIGGGPPSTTNPEPPATVAVPPRAGVDAALAAIPKGVPSGHIGRDALEEPLGRARFERCHIPNGTRVRIDAVIYDGAAVGVDVRSTPSRPEIDACVEQVVRETSWAREAAVNRVTSKL